MNPMDPIIIRAREESDSGACSNNGPPESIEKNELTQDSMNICRKRLDSCCAKSVALVP
jgi:hypothetical protein